MVSCAIDRWRYVGRYVHYIPSLQPWDQHNLYLLPPSCFVKGVIFSQRAVGENNTFAEGLL